MSWRAKLCCFILGFAALATACRWDRDTLAEEAKGSTLDVLKVIVGRFDRNPPLYYQMRLDRIAKEIAVNPGSPDLYNDAAVACDQLGKFDEAIAWMQKQEKILETARVTPDVMYRFNANLGTFYAHRWFANKADLSKPQDLDKGIDYIKRAIEINPDAHFGREKIQLALMEWAKDGTARGDSEFVGAPVSSYLLDKNLVDWNKGEDAIEGFTGLIRLGNAWESVDVFAGLADALMYEGLGTTGEAALARVLELQSMGKTSMTKWRFENKTFFEGRPMGNEQVQAKSEFKRLRQEADEWHKSRTDFMLAKLEKGKHPDTDPNFWSGFEESKVEVKDLPSWQTVKFQQNALMVGIPTILVGGLVTFVWIVIRLVFPKKRVKSNPNLSTSNEADPGT